MRLYFLRHAEAHPGVDDDARELTDHGEEQAREIGCFLKRAGIEFGAAYSSPLVRARQTSEIVLKITNAETDLELEIVPSLRNETTQPAFNRWLGQLPDKKHILLVGHAPSMPDRVRYLLGMENEESLMLPKAGLACVKTDNPRQGTLKFFISPKLLK